MVKTFVLRLKAAESFLEISQCTLRTQERRSAENPDYKMRKEQILSGIGDDPDKPKIFIKKNVRNHSCHQFHPVLAKIRINRGLLYIW